MERRKTYKQIIKTIQIYGVIAAGSFVAAVGVSVFLAPLSLVAGGVSGIAIILNRIFGLPIGILMLCINLPLFLIGWRFLGRGFGLRSLAGAVLFSVFTDLTQGLPVITQTPILAALFGGALLGFGIGAVILTGATTGGTDIVARVGYHLVHAIDVGKWLFIMDSVIIVANGIVFGSYELTLYGIIALIINSYLVDFMIQGANFAKMVYIISPKYDEIAQKLLNKLERGVTAVYARGMYADTKTCMLLCVVKRFQIQKLEKIVEETDPNAFLIFTQVRQVTGEGFKIYPLNE